ncbi:hypothetical protein [Rivularia sp. UHCC 0363]|uniref:hypothetical protein n=1 Tax=Rivularia sp. UHCC 0363 TaxID=3110244 RepID=UPI002B2136F7|nr:hypothetical protein [Rivularia sp. UHCC 0363]MEA5594528.1 hypothetical protein [Rivularia sp. UHCC 0363]
MSIKFISQAIKLSFVFLSLAAASGISTIVSAQEASVPIFGDITIGHPLSKDPLTVRGMSGGSIPAKEISQRADTPTGACTGYVDKEPDHTLRLKSKFDYMKLVIESPEDTTLIIKGPGGMWCNDEFEGKNPGIVGEWLNGDYQVWIGSYKKEQYLPYTLKITEIK